MSISLKLETINALKYIINGGDGDDYYNDKDLSPYRTLDELVDFFNHYGGVCIKWDDLSAGCRFQFTQDQLKQRNNSEDIQLIIEATFHRQYFIDNKKDIDSAVNYMNKYLIYDGLKLINKGLNYHLIKINEENNDRNIATQTFLVKLDIESIHQQSNKCKKKIEDEDYDGVISNARTMVEEVFKAILEQKNVDISIYKGDLNKMYSEIKTHLNLNPGQKDLNDTLKNILSGLGSIVNGISGISNKMGDRHAKKYIPKKRHAVLAVDTAHIFCEFLISSQEHQKKDTPSK